MALVYKGVTLSDERLSHLKKLGEKYNTDYRFYLTQLWVETNWGSNPNSTSARVDNNWGGMTWAGNPQRPSGIIVSQGLARPSNEGGHYMHYNTVEDFLEDWAYLLRPNGNYRVAGVKTIEDYTRGLFRIGGAQYDYAASGYEHYLALMKPHYESMFKEDKEVDALVVNAETVLNTARKYMGVTKYSNGHKQIVDRYNAERPLPLGYAVKYDDDWCDCFVSTIGILSGASDLIGRECGVQRHINIFQQKGIWLGKQKPQAGDIITWDWDAGGFADHIGFVEKVNGDTITTIEGNTTHGGVSLVGRNTFHWNDWRIKGYARPKYSNAPTTPTTNPSPGVSDTIKKHIVCTIDELRVFNKPSGSATIVDTIKKGQIKNIDRVERDGQYLWASYISYAGDRRYTTVETADGSRKFAELKDGFIDHNAKPVDETKETIQISENQKVGGERAIDLKPNEFVVNGVVYVVNPK